MAISVGARGARGWGWPRFSTRMTLRRRDNLLSIRLTPKGSIRRIYADTKQWWSLDGTVEFSRRDDMGTGSCGGAKEILSVPSDLFIGSLSIIISESLNNPPGSNNSSSSSIDDVVGDTSTVTSSVKMSHIGFQVAIHIQTFRIVLNLRSVEECGW